MHKPKPQGGGEAAALSCQMLSKQPQGPTTPGGRKPSDCPKSWWLIRVQQKTSCPWASAPPLGHAGYHAWGRDVVGGCLFVSWYFLSNFSRTLLKKAFLVYSKRHFFLLKKILWEFHQTLKQTPVIQGLNSAMPFYSLVLETYSPGPCKLWASSLGQLLTQNRFVGLQMEPHTSFLPLPEALAWTKMEWDPSTETSKTLPSLPCSFPWRHRHQGPSAGINQPPESLQAAVRWLSKIRDGPG